MLTTAAGADRLGGNAIGLEPWSSVQVEAPGGGVSDLLTVPGRGETLALG